MTGRPSNITKVEYPTRYLAFGYTASYDTGYFRSLSLTLLTAKALSIIRSLVIVLGKLIESIGSFAYVEVRVVILRKNHKMII